MNGEVAEWGVRIPTLKPWTFTSEDAARAFYFAMLGQRLVRADETVFRVTELELLHRDIPEWEVIDQAYMPKQGSGAE
jgi:hypothetical protein